MTHKRYCYGGTSKLNFFKFTIVRKIGIWAILRKIAKVSEKAVEMRYKNA